MHRIQVFLTGFDAVGLAGLWPLTEHPALAKEPPVPAALAEEAAQEQPEPPSYCRTSWVSLSPSSCPCCAQVGLFLHLAIGSPCSHVLAGAEPWSQQPLLSLHCSSILKFIPIHVRSYKVLAPAVPRLGSLSISLENPSKNSGFL